VPGTAPAENGFNLQSNSLHGDELLIPISVQDVSKTMGCAPLHPSYNLLMKLTNWRMIIRAQNRSLILVQTASEDVAAGLERNLV